MGQGYDRRVVLLRPVDHVTIQEQFENQSMHFSSRHFQPRGENMQMLTLYVRATFAQEWFYCIVAKPWQ